MKTIITIIVIFFMITSYAIFTWNETMISISFIIGLIIAVYTMDLKKPIKKNYIKIDPYGEEDWEK